MDITIRSDSFHGTFGLPEAWDDVRPGLLSRIARSPHSDRDTIACTIIRHTLGKKLFRQLDPIQVYDITQYMGFIERPIYRPLMDSFRYRLRKYYFSEPRMWLSTAREFVLADHFYEQYITTEDTYYACCVLACVARRKRKTDEDEYRELIPSKRWIEERAHHFHKAPFYLLRTALKYVSDTKEYFHEHYGKILYSEKPDKYNDVYTWHDTFVSIAEGPVFGDIHKVYDASIHDLFYYLIQKKKEADKMKEEMADLKK